LARIASLTALLMSSRSIVCVLSQAFGGVKHLI
jgi:hypothetical protein